MRQVTLAVVGCGQRGSVYSALALDEPDRVKVVAVVDPRPEYRNRLGDLHAVALENRFKTWEDLAALPRMADACIIATPDQLHMAPTIAFSSLGYAILLEKPMAVTEEDCKAILDACVANKTILAVGHVLRYTPHVRTITDLIRTGRIGDIVHLQHTEPVGNWHFAHSFVRGNWRSEGESTFALMAKCCHDVDLINHWMKGLKATKVTSLGNLSHFHPGRKPQGATLRCLDCPVAASCPYDAKRIYVDSPQTGVANGNTGWPVDVVSAEHTVDAVMEQLRTGPYGRCVYDCDNDVVDNQVVTFQYDNGSTATLTMVATTDAICQRVTNVFGSKGEITCRDTETVVVKDFVTGRAEVIQCLTHAPKTRLTGHGYADYYLMDSFVRAVAENDPSHIMTSPQDCYQSHALVFRAEEARKAGRVVDLPAANLDW